MQELFKVWLNEFGPWGIVKMIYFLHGVATTIVVGVKNGGLN